MKVTLKLTVEEFKQLFGVSVVNNVVCELKETGLQPNWDDAPEWATSWAVDENEKAHWYEGDKVETDVYQWIFSGYNEDDDMFEFDRKVSLNGIDWKTTLRKRPLQ